VFGRLARAGYLRDLGPGEFVDRLAALLADVNALHPFREGNGPHPASVPRPTRP
jgi:cell filamentation protein